MSSRQPWSNQARVSQQRVTQKSASYTNPGKTYTSRISCPARQSFYKNLEEQYIAHKVNRRPNTSPSRIPVHQEGHKETNARVPSRKVSPIWKSSGTTRNRFDASDECKIFTSEFIRHMTPAQSRMLIPKLTKKKCPMARGPCPQKRPVTEQMSADQPYYHRHPRVTRNCSAYNYTNEGMSGHLKYGVFRQAHNRTKRSERMQPAYRRPMPRAPMEPVAMRERGVEKELRRLHTRVWRRVGEQGNQMPKDAPLLVVRTIDGANHRHLHQSSVMHMDIRPRMGIGQPLNVISPPRIISQGNRRLVQCQSHMSPLSTNRIFSPANVSSDLLSSSFESPRANYFRTNQPCRRCLSPPSFFNAPANFFSSRNSSFNRILSPDLEFRRPRSPIKTQRESYSARSKGTQQCKLPSSNGSTYVNRVNPSNVSIHHKQSYRSVRLRNWLRNVSGLRLDAKKCNLIPSDQLETHSRAQSTSNNKNTQSDMKKQARVQTAKQSQKVEARDRNLRLIKTNDSKPQSRDASFQRSKSYKRLPSVNPSGNAKPSNRMFLTCTCSVSPTFNNSSIRLSRSKSVSSSYRTVSPELVPPSKGTFKKVLSRSRGLSSTRESFCQT